MKKLISTLLVATLVLTNFQGWNSLKEVSLFKDFDLFQGINKSYAYEGILLKDLGIFYTISGGKAHIVDAHPNISGDLIIPKTIEGYPVTSIEDDAFQDCDSLTNITIPKGVTSIGRHAFQDCSLLRNITIPNSVTYIGNGAFKYCSSLSSINIPEGVTRIEGVAFESCSSLRNITIPNSVTYIGGGAFKNCSLLSSVNIPEGVTRIENYTFKSCNSLRNITIPNSVTYIGYEAFKYCDSLTSITIPESVTRMENDAFEACSSLRSLIILEGLTNIGNYAFNGCSSLSNIVIPYSVTNIGAYAFNGISNKCTIYGYKYSYAQEYAASYNINFKQIEILLNTNELNLGLNDIYTLKASMQPQIISNSNIKWNSSDKNIVSVDQNGNIKANSIGTATITVTNKDFDVEASCIVKVNNKLSITVGDITNLKYTSTTSTETLSWTAVSKASGYEVWMYKSSVGDYAKIKTITSGSTTSYKRSNLTSATMYRYKVRAYRTVNGVKYYGNFTNEFITGTKPLTPSITLSSTQKGKIKITWSNISKKTTGYQIYRSTSRYGTYSRIATIEDGNVARSYTNSGRTSGKTYYYKVRAYRTLNNGKKVYSSYSTVKYIKAK